MKKILLLAAILFPFVLLGQVITCGNTLVESLMELDHPGYKTAEMQTVIDAQNHVQYRNGDTLTIPVVVHVIHNTPTQNLPDDLIHRQIATMNQDFNRANDDAVLTRDIFLDVAAAANIEFKLANIDPAGNSTTGITHTETSVSSFVDFNIIAYFQALSDCGVDIFDPQSLANAIECINEALNLDLDKMKSSETGGVDPWDNDKYLNIWICNMSVDINGSESPFVLGFAYPPVGAPNWPTESFPEDYEEKDGIVLHYEAVGPDNPANTSIMGIADLGRTATHEAGHYLGLRHIWGDGDCIADDFIDDTPTTANNSGPTDLENLATCEQLHNNDTCPNSPMPDMIENYMDYTVDVCQNMFTQGQVDLMRAMLEGPRASLLEGTVTSISSVDNVQYQIYPTITHGQLTIKGEVTSGLKYLVTSLDGKSVISGTLNGEGIDVSPVLHGVYIVRLLDQNQVLHTSKVIKI